MNLKDVVDMTRSFQFNAAVTCDSNGDIHYPGDSGEEIRALKKLIKKYNKSVKGTGKQQYRVGLQGRLGYDSPHAHHYKGRSYRRIKLKHSAYVGVYIWAYNNYNQ